jgi:general secretion pathway protein M
MTSESATIRNLAGSRLVAITVFVFLIFGFVATTWISIADILDRRDDLANSEDLLDRLKGRSGKSGNPLAAGPTRTGSPYLEGPTLTVAGASLLQRVTGAITQAGGTVQSSQINIEGNQGKDGFIGLLISCEADQPGLQKILYDLEAGMPFLFVDQLDVQMSQTAAANESAPARARIILGVSGQWQNKK